MDCCQPRQRNSPNAEDHNPETKMASLLAAVEAIFILLWICCLQVQIA